jgi:hypothetical protein
MQHTLRNITLLLLCTIAVLHTHAQTNSSRIKFWINPVFAGRAPIDETNEHHISFLADQYDAYFRYVKALKCFEIVVDLSTAEPREKGAPRPEFELTISYTDQRGHYAYFPMICVVSDSMVRTMENKLTIVVWNQTRSKKIVGGNPYIRYASLMRSPIAGIKNDSFYCEIPLVEDSATKQVSFPALIEFAATEKGPPCDTSLCTIQSTIETIPVTVKTEKRSFYRITQQPHHTCCIGSNTEYYHEYLKLPLNNEIVYIEVIRPDQSKTTIPIKMKRIRAKLPEWRMVH